MRAAIWPYRRIAKWLREERGISISHEAVRQFCVVRSIEKGAMPPTPNIGEGWQTPISKVRGVRPRKTVIPKFDYDDSQPITRKRP